MSVGRNVGGPDPAALRNSEEAFRRDSDDREREPVHLHRSADDRGIPAERPHPESVPDDGHRRGARRIVRGLETPSENRSDAEHGEVVSGNQQAGCDGGRAADRNVDVVGGKKREEIGQPGDAAPDFAVRRGGNAAGIGSAVLLGVARVDVRCVGAFVDPPLEYRQPLRLRDRQRVEQHSADDAVDGDVGADPERERQHGHGGEGRALAQQPRGVADIRPERLERGEGPQIAAGLPQARRVAEAPSRGIGIPALGSHRQVERQFVFEVALQLPTSEQRPNPQPQSAQPLSHARLASHKLLMGEFAPFSRKMQAKTGKAGSENRRPRDSVLSSSSS